MKSGFSVIEILVSIAVLAILLSFITAGYSNFHKRQKVNGAGQSVKNILRDAQSRAYTGEVNCTICDCDSSEFTFEGWYVDFANKQIYGQCSAKRYSNKPFDLPTDVYITPYSEPPDRFRFRYSPPGVDQDVTLCVTSKDATDTYFKIVVNKAGDISDSGDLLTSCTP